MVRTDLHPEIEAAVARLASVVRETPCLPHDDDVWFKLENTQRTGAFKLRGAYNRIAADPAAQANGVVTVSSGNHGRAVAVVAELLGVRATVCVPDWVDPVKRAAIEAAGAAIVLSGPTYEDAEAVAERLARDEGLAFVHPFDDPLVIAGQATLGVELAAQLPHSVDTVFVPLSGGGLATGVALGLRYGSHPARVIGVCAAAAPSMYESLRSGCPVEVTEDTTLASALSGGIGLANKWTFDLARSVLADVLLATETEIATAVRFAAGELHQVVEGGAATSVAAWLRGRPGHTACVLSGGNIDLRVLATVLAG